MGEAKLRGSFEERRAEAKEASAQKLQIKKEEELAYQNSLSEEEKKAVKARKVRVNQLIAFACSMGSSLKLNR